MSTTGQTSANTIICEGSDGTVIWYGRDTGQKPTATL